MLLTEDAGPHARRDLRENLAVAAVACLFASAAIPAGASSMSRYAAGTRPTLHRQAYMRELETLARDGDSGAVAVVVTPAGTWKAAVGWAEFKKRHADPDDRFAIESTTKTFVAAAVLQLVGERRLTLEDTVQHWLPGLLPTRPAITVRELLNHTSGLPPDFTLGQSLRARVDAIAGVGALSKPGTSTTYSNGNYVLLGLIVEKVTGRRLDRVVTDRIIRPLHLDSTSYGTEHAKRRAAWLGYREFSAPPVSGDGGIISTAGDLATFFRALMSGKVVRDELLLEMTHTVRTDEPGLRVGLGIFAKRFSCGVAWGHGGELGYSVDVAVARDGSKAVVVARNNPNVGDGERVKERLYCT